MNYKKMSLRAMMLALVVGLFAGFTSCSNSDDNNSSTSTEDTSIPVSGVMQCNFEPSEDQLAIFDFTVEYTDESGQTKTEAITGAWEKKVTFKTLPAKASLTIKRTLKPNVELTKDSYNVGRSLTANVLALKADGTKAGLGKTPASGSIKSAIGKDKVEKYAQEKAVVISFSYTISNKANAEGEYVY